MSKLFHLREWVTVNDAAKYLSDELNGEVTETDLLQLATEEKLSLSIFFSSTVNVRELKKISFSIPKNYPLRDIEGLYASVYDEQEDDDFLLLSVNRESIDSDYCAYTLYRTNRTSQISGVCDFVSCGQSDIESEFLSKKFHVKTICKQDCIYVVETANKFIGYQVFELLTPTDQSEHIPGIGLTKETDQSSENEYACVEETENQQDTTYSSAWASILIDGLSMPE